MSMMRIRIVIPVLASAIILSLMQDESRKLSLYRSLKWPLYHCMKIKNNYIYDDPEENNRRQLAYTSIFMSIYDKGLISTRPVTLEDYTQFTVMAPRHDSPFSTYPPTL